jgi:hypothetical protein
MLLTILVDLQFKDDESSFIDKTRQDQLHCKEIKHDLGYPYTFVHYKKLVYFSGPKFVGKGSEFVGNVSLPRTFPTNTFMGKRAAIVRTFSRNVVGNACQRVSAQL